MINVSHDRDHRRARQQFVGRLGRGDRQLRLGAVRTRFLDDVAHLRDDNSGGVAVEHLVDGYHAAELHQDLDNLHGLDRHLLRQLGHGNGFGQHDLAHDRRGGSLERVLAGRTGDHVFLLGELGLAFGLLAVGQMQLLTIALFVACALVLAVFFLGRLFLRRRRGSLGFRGRCRRARRCGRRRGHFDDGCRLDRCYRFRARRGGGRLRDGFVGDRPPDFSTLDEGALLAHLDLHRARGAGAGTLGNLGGGLALERDLAARGTFVGGAVTRTQIAEQLFLFLVAEHVVRLFFVHARGPQLAQQRLGRYADLFCKTFYGGLTHATAVWPLISLPASPRTTGRARS